jgi:hypothetical protein
MFRIGKGINFTVFDAGWITPAGITLSGIDRISGKPIRFTLIRAFLGLNTFSRTIAQESSHILHPVHLLRSTAKCFFIDTCTSLNE